MDYLKINKALWNAKTDIHIKSDFYQMEAFLSGKSSLKSIELDLLKNIDKKSILHLQCHFGQDSLSLARMGANVTGIDLSDRSIEAARELAIKTNLEAAFIQTDVYKVPEVISEKFDMVFTTYGTVGWLPDIDRWAEVIMNMLKPGGTLIFVEFHPVIWMFDYDFKDIEFSYFNKEMIVEEIDGTYADRNAPIKNKSVGWNHSLSEVFSALNKHDLKINFFKEYDYSPYDCFSNMIQIAEDKYQIQGLEEKLPMVYAIRATFENH